MEFHFHCMDCARFGKSCTDMTGTEPAGSCFVNPKCSVCEYYAGVNQESGICTYHYRTKQETPGAASVHDDYVAASDSCKHFRDRHEKCMYCKHYQKGRAYGIGYCDIMPPAGQVQKRKHVSASDICGDFETDMTFYNPITFKKEGEPK